jgi:hypothetical protein
MQAAEADLLAAGKRHVRMEGVAGQFEWFAMGADHEPIEDARPDDIQEIERILVTEGGRNTTVETAAGIFIWRPKR